MAGSTGVVKSACSAAKSVLISRLDERGFFEFTSKKAQHVLILLRHQIVCSDLKLLAGGAWMPDDDATMMHSRNMRKLTIRSIAVQGVQGWRWKWKTQISNCIMKLLGQV